MRIQAEGLLGKRCGEGVNCPDVLWTDKATELGLRDPSGNGYLVIGERLSSAQLKQVDSPDGGSLADHTAPYERGVFLPEAVVDALVDAVIARRAAATQA